MVSMSLKGQKSILVAEKAGQRLTRLCVLGIDLIHSQLLHTQWPYCEVTKKKKKKKKKKEKKKEKEKGRY